MPIKVLFLDCDGTLTKVKSSWEYLHRGLNLWNENAEHYQELFRRGDIGYYEFCRRDALLWRGLSLSSVYELIDEIPYQEGVKEAMGRFREAGIHTFIISSGLSLLVDKVKQDLSINQSLSNELLASGGYLTGEVKIHVEYDKKGEIVNDALRRLGFGRDEAAAVGDGHGDRGMFDAVGLPIGFDNGDDGHAHGCTEVAGSFDDVADILLGGRGNA